MTNKYLTHDYLHKFSLENPYSKQQHGEFPRLNKIIVTSNIDYKSIINKTEVLINKNNFLKNSALSSLLLKLMFLFSRIFGQTPKLLKAHKSVANFNLREGMNVGVYLTLRPKNLFRVSAISLQGIPGNSYDYIKKLFLFILPLWYQKENVSARVAGPYLGNFQKRAGFEKTVKQSESIDLTPINTSVPVQSQKSYSSELNLLINQSFNQGSFLFGFTSLSFFNPFFSDKEYLEYTTIINEIKNSAEFIGSGMNILFTYTGDLPFLLWTNKSKNFFMANPVYLGTYYKGLNMKDAPLDLIRRSYLQKSSRQFKEYFILSYLLFPF